FVVVGLTMLWIRRRQGAPTLAPVATGEGRPLDEDAEGMYDVETYDEDEGGEGSAGATVATSADPMPAAPNPTTPAKRPAKSPAKPPAKRPTKRRPPAA